MSPTAKLEVASLEVKVSASVASFDAPPSVTSAEVMVIVGGGVRKKPSSAKTEVKMKNIPKKVITLVRFLRNVELSAFVSDVKVTPLPFVVTIETRFLLVCLKRNMAHSFEALFLTIIS
jgi:hypothetical protein